MTLTEFILARIADDEAMGKAAAKDAYGRASWSLDAWACDEQGSHVALDPPRVLAECEAKRRIVELAEQFGTWEGGMADATLQLLALPYVDHSDYDESWRP